MRAAAVLLLQTLATAVSPSPEADFRASRWGDTVEQVRAVETAPFHHLGDDELAYTDSSVEGIDGGIVYLFERGRLVRGVYVSRQDYPAGAGAPEAYERLKAHFDTTLGRVGETTERWLDDSLRGDPPRLAEAVVLEQVRVTTRWRFERTHVELIMSGRDGGVYLRAVFQPSR
jgi:hypothetical protein